MNYIPTSHTITAGFIFFIGGALIIVGALAWNNALSALFTKIFHFHSVFGLFIYAIIITIIAVLLLFWFSHLLGKELNFPLTSQSLT